MGDVTGSLDLSALGLSLPGFGPAVDADEDDDEDGEYPDDDEDDDAINEIDAITVDPVGDSTSRKPLPPGSDGS
jgi:hypothetical protein